MTDATQITWQDNDPRMDEMAAWVRRLVRALRKAAPGNALAEKALDDLKRRGLLGDVLREAEEPDPLHVANERGEGEPVAWKIMASGLLSRAVWTDDPIVVRHARASAYHVQPLFGRRPPSVPDGWKLVPLEPTAEMINAGVVHSASEDETEPYRARGEAIATYMDMLAAAPKEKP